MKERKKENRKILDRWIDRFVLVVFMARKSSQLLIMIYMVAHIDLYVMAYCPVIHTYQMYWYQYMGYHTHTHTHDTHTSAHTHTVVLILRHVTSRTHVRLHTRTHARTHALHARTHTHTHARTHTSHFLGLCTTSHTHLFSHTLDTHTHTSLHTHTHTSSHIWLTHTFYFMSNTCIYISHLLDVPQII